MIKTVWCATFQVSNLEKAGGVEIGLVPKLKKGEKVNASSPSVDFLVDDVEKFYNELKNKGVKFIKELHEEPWGGRQAAFKDLDGNILEVVQINWKKYFDASAKGTKKL